MLYQVSSGLAYQHSKRIVHRDLNLVNVLLTEDGTVKIADYGLFHVLDEEGQAIPGGQGTKLYISLEALEGRLHTKSDIYSLGVMLHELMYVEHEVRGGNFKRIECYCK